MKTLKLVSNGGYWHELRQDKKRFLVKTYVFNRICRMKWYRNLAAATDDFIEVCGIDSQDIETIFHSEKKGGEK